MSKRLKAVSLGSMALVATGAVIWGIWYHQEQHSVSTDDCRVEASIVSVGAKLSDRLLEVRVEEGDMIKKGQILVVLDDRSIHARELAAQSKVDLMKARYDEMMAGFPSP